MILTVLFAAIAAAVYCAPMLLEVDINPKESALKVTRPSLKLLDSLETNFGVPMNALFQVEAVKKIPLLNINDIEENSSDYIVSVIASENLDGSSSYLMAPLAVPKDVLEKILTDRNGAFLQILLPGHDVLPPEALVNQTDSGNATAQAVIIVPEPTREQALAKFYRQFLKVNTDGDSQYIPQSVLNVLKDVQQVLIHPKTFLQIPEGQTNQDAQVFTITSATPVNVTMGLFEIVPY